MCVCFCNSVCDYLEKLVRESSCNSVCVINVGVSCSGECVCGD